METQKLTDGFEAHGSWFDDASWLAIHYNSGEGDPRPTNVYLIKRAETPDQWQPIGKPEWGEDVRLPNADASGRYVLMTARAKKPDSEATHAMASYQGYQIWIYDREKGTHQELSSAEHAVEGAWFIP